ncbi:hypothetical protein Fmac_015746 [Flemingia macrophylla]|uniref:Cysteine-rich receptor-like protein kinase n=1 Tax=Flemingia macrophylla TaxID=520843 RepID=A0ABD1MGB7_9FABA
MASFKILLLFVLVIFLSFATSQAQDDFTPVYLYHNCSGSHTTDGSTFQSNVKILLSSLASNSLTNTGFNNTRVLGKIPSDSVFGMFMCRGDVTPQTCQNCVQNATQRLSSECSLAKQGVIWYDECTLRYSNRSFFSTVDTRPRLGLLNTGNVSNQESFMLLLFRTINQTADEAALGDRNRKYATKESNVSAFQTLYCLAQCTPDLSLDDCRRCLSGVIGDLPWCCQGKQGGRVLYPSCNIRYELYPFYRTANSSIPTWIPTSNFPNASDTEFSEDPTYLYHNCTTNATSGSTFKLNLQTLLSYMSSNATNGKESYKDDVDDTAYGLFMCRSDLPSRLCEKCIINATHKISSECNSFREAIIWYSHCMLRYSYRYFFSQVETSPAYQRLNVTSGLSSSVPEQEFFTYTLSTMLANMAEEISHTSERHVTETAKLNNLQTLYTLGQCTEDLSSDDCKSCLQDIIGTIPWSRLGSVGGRVLNPSCNVRFELFQFYRVGDEAESPRPVGHESATLEPLQFNLAIIEAATNNFSNDNRIGIGGFGEVYKGILSDGRQVAVKRLSTSSKQGANKFKNEVLLIAKLQHRNLVTFIGFCLEERDKILIYEYVPNKNFQRSKLLSWHERYNIIGGIARGILYLHEHSRLKVIHRDLKPSNILLDENMIPKILDFGLARIVEINQDQWSTNRIVGTFGYISPEYAMFGHFSEKSDVFSFGVMVLEIITGKKNLSSFEPHRLGDGLLSYVWIQWRSETPLCVLDSSIEEKYSKTEVIKCIQIGLLCVQQNPNDRPTMVEVASYLNSHLIELPSPQEPAFFLQSRMNPRSSGQESSYIRSINGSNPLSDNDMSITEFIPR